MDNKTIIETSEQLSSINSKYNAYKIKRNDFNTLDSNEDDYVFEETLQLVEKTSKIEGKQNQQTFHQINSKKNEQNAKSFMNELQFPNHIKSMSHSSEHQSDQQVQDFTQAWNQIEETQFSRKFSEQVKANEKCKDNFPIAQEQKEQTQKIEFDMSSHNNSDKSSSYEMSPEQIKAWMKQCQQNSPHHEGQNDSNQYRPTKLQNFQSGNPHKDWGSWEQIVNQLQKESQKTNNQLEGYQQMIENLAPIQQAVRFQEVNQSITSFTIIDPIEQFYNLKNKHFIPETQTEKDIEQQASFQETSAYGPFKQNVEYYEIYGEYRMQLVQDIRVGAKGINFCTEDMRLIEKNCRCLRKINWEIQEEKKPNIKWNKMKKICRTTIIEHNKDFYIADHAKFSITPINEGAHIYFGMRMFGDFSEQKESSSWTQAKIRGMKDYLYLPATGQCLLQTKYSNFQINQNHSMQVFDVILSLTKQKLATCQRIIQTDRDKKQFVYIRALDMFEKCVGEYLGLIQSKISQFSDQWYCETTIFIPKKKVFSKKNIQKDSDKLKIKLRLSEFGSIVAELGIYDATSSITNCILFNQNKSMQFMMAAIEEKEDQINLLSRFAGISPLVGFVAAVCRKLFVHYPEC